MERDIVKVKYEKTKLDDNYEKFTINNDCIVIGDSDNITKLSEYFDELNSMVSNSAESAAIFHLKEAVKILDNTSKQQKNTFINDQFGQRKCQNIYEIIDHCVDFNDTLGRLIPEEVLNLVEQYGDEEAMDEAFLSIDRNSMPATWLKNNLGSYCYEFVNKYVPGGQIFLKASSNYIDPEMLHSEISKSKYTIDQAGGLSTLFMCAVNDASMGQVAANIGVHKRYIGRYLSLYGFDGWKNWLAFVHQVCDNDWNVCYETLSSQ